MTLFLKTNNLKAILWTCLKSKKFCQSHADNIITLMRMELRMKLKATFVINLMHCKNGLIRQAQESRRDLQPRHTVLVL